jgi:signal transduction histidine kinase
MKKILVIDDEAWLREMVQMALHQRGFEVVQAENGACGVELARKEVPDLILCDVNMDTMDGYRTLSCLRNEAVTASIPFILMTGLADHAGMRHGMELGADDYLPKPFTLDGLFAAVEARLKKALVVRQEAEKKLADLRDSLSLMLPHELRTPLNGILTCAEMLSSQADQLPPSEVAEMGGMICESGRRLERLIENFLIYAQLQLFGADPGKVAALQQRSTSNPASVVERACREQAHREGRQSDLAFDLNDTPVQMAEEYLARIAGELAHNALKFSTHGTPVRIWLAEAENCVVLTVRDQGRGFSAEHIQRIGAYMQFDRKLHEQQGQGLGLAIAKRLVELHGGTMTVQSEPRAGTTVGVKLPKKSASQL